MYGKGGESGKGGGGILYGGGREAAGVGLLTRGNMYGGGSSG